MIPTLPSKIQPALAFPTEFNREWGAKPHTLLLCDFPQGDFKGLHFKNWKFDRVTFEEATFDSTVFENCTFNHCTFRLSKITRTRFLNSPFHKVTWDAIEADSLHFEGGEWVDFGLASSQGMNTQILNSTVVGITIRDCSIHADIGTNITFKDCRLLDNNFREMQVWKSHFENTLIQNNDFWEAKLASCHFTQCHILDNKTLGYSGQRRFNHCTIRLKAIGMSGDGVDDDVLNHTKIDLSAVTYTYSAGWGEGSTYENFTPKPRENFGFTFGLGVDPEGDCVGNTYRNIAGRNGFFGFRGLYKDCLFENLEMDYMHLDWARFENCTFRNLKVHTTIFVEDAKFKNITCENCVIDPGVNIIQNGTVIPEFPGLPFDIPKP